MRRQDVPSNLNFRKTKVTSLRLCPSYPTRELITNCSFILTADFLSLC